MKKLFIVLLTFTFSFATSQITTRTIEVKAGQMDKFIEMAGKKTKKFNNEEGAARFFTYEILTGSDAGKIWRMRASDAQYMDNWDSNSEESNYWQKNVGPYIADHRFLFSTVPLPETSVLQFQRQRFNVA